MNKDKIIRYIKKYWYIPLIIGLIIGLIFNYFNYFNLDIVKVTHNAGFFSCCSIRLNSIIDYINLNKRLPDIVDSSEQFNLYKKNDEKEDITFDYFKNYDKINNVNIIIPIDYKQNQQFSNYNNLNYKSITPLIKKYFTPSTNVNKIVNNLVKKYNIIYKNTLSVYYRGTDKYKETKIDTFDEFYKQIIKITDINKNINILIQTDTSQFIDYINSKNLKNIIIINENKTSYKNNGIHNEQSGDENYYDMFNFIATILIISKCKYIICSSGNCSIWAMFYRGNCKNVIQNLNKKWHNSVF